MQTHRKTDRAERPQQAPTLLDRIDMAYSADLTDAKQPGVSLPALKAVLVALVRHTDEEWRCRPSIKRLVAMTGHSEKPVRRALTALVEAGRISRLRSRRTDGTYGGYRYRVLLRPPVTLTAGPPVTLTVHEGVDLEGVEEEDAQAHEPPKAEVRAYVEKVGWSWQEWHAEPADARRAAVGALGALRARESHEDVLAGLEGLTAERSAARYLLAVASNWKPRRKKVRKKAANYLSGRPARRDEFGPSSSEVEAF